MAKKIFALEGEWETRLEDKFSIKPVLDFVATTSNVDYIHRRCVLKETLSYYLERLKSYKSFPIVYLAFHGSNSKIKLEDESINLLELANLSNGAFQNRYVHFGSCSTARNLEKLNQFKQETGAVMVSGFTEDISFIDGTLMDIALLNRLQEHKYSNGVKNMPSHYDSLIEKTGFVIV